VLTPTAGLLILLSFDREGLMICPHCNTAIVFEPQESDIFQEPGSDEYGNRSETGACIACGGLIIALSSGRIDVRRMYGGQEYQVLDPAQREVLFPRHSARVVQPEVPGVYQEDFLEACAVLPVSPKASAALSRRALQHVIQDHFNIRRGSLAQQIDEFIARADVPSYLGEAVDAVRNIGNFAAHPLKDTNTGELAAVEPGEAEWLIEVLESLFDFAFVQPSRLAERRQKLNEKLAALGKPPMKG
jgi:hypothetical protein